MPKITRICHDSPTRDDCPALHASDDGRLFVQGYAVTDPEILDQIGIPAGETVAEITPALLAMMNDPAAASRIRAARAVRA